MNRVVHFEIQATDPDRAQRFYNSVFGWDMKNLGEEMGNYRMIMTGNDAPGTKWPGINGGMSPRKGDAPVDGQAVNAYVCIIDVDDVVSCISKVKEAGGVTALDTMEVPGVGKLAYMKDTEGNLFGILQPS